MFLSFTNINSGYISKVYKIPFNNNYLPGEIDLFADSEDMWIIPMYSPNKIMIVGENQTETWDLTNFKYSQGFTIGWNEKYGYYFSHGHNNTNGDNATTTIMTLSYINDNNFNPAKEYDEELNLIKLFTNPSIKIKEYKTYYSKQTTIKPTEYPPPHELWTEEEPEDFEEESVGAWIDCIVYMDGHYEYSDVNELITTNDIDIICNS